MGHGIVAASNSSNRIDGLMMPGSLLMNGYPPLEPPPSGFNVSSRATMQEELDTFTIPRGYSVRIAGAKVAGKRKVRRGIVEGHLS